MLPWASSGERLGVALAGDQRSQHLASPDPKREFLVIHHTGCGMLTFTNAELQGRLKQETGADASAIDFLPFADLEASVREDVRRIRESPFIDPAITVSGFIYDVGSGRLQPVG